jgi:hypothetical protein
MLWYSHPVAFFLEEITMSKDPAFLFYPSDFLSGTMFFTDEQTGKYIRLLCVQHQHGSLTEEQMMFISKSYDKDIWSKFDKDDDGRFFQHRLKEEIEKRKKYCESRGNNKRGKIKKEDNTKIISKSYDNHMGNINRNKDIDVVDLPFKSIEFSEKWNEYTKFRSENRYPKFKLTGLKNHFSRLMKLCGGNEQTAIAIYNEAMANNYQGIFPLKEKKDGTNKKPGQSSAVQFKIDDHGQPTRELINEYIQSRSREKNNASQP